MICVSACRYWGGGGPDGKGWTHGNRPVSYPVLARLNEGGIARTPKHDQKPGGEPFG